MRLQGVASWTLLTAKAEVHVQGVSDDADWSFFSPLFIFRRLMTLATWNSRTLFLWIGIVHGTAVYVIYSCQLIFGHNLCTLLGMLRAGVDVHWRTWHWITKKTGLEPLTCYEFKVQSYNNTIDRGEMSLITATTGQSGACLNFNAFPPIELYFFFSRFFFPFP